MFIGSIRLLRQYSNSARVKTVVWNRMSTTTTSSMSNGIHKVWKPQDHIPSEVQVMLSKPQPNYILSFLHVVQQLKIQRRTGWLDHDINPCESIADHMYRMSITSMLINDTKVNRDKCVRIALVHDIAEALVGDITPFGGVTKEEKHRREWETIQYLCENLIEPHNRTAAEEIMNDWLAYENISSLEARYVKDIDKYEMLVQCFEYERASNGQKNLEQFWSAVSSVKTEEVGSWVKDLCEERREYFAQLSRKK
ncbi:hypothetical protein HG535_0B01630 [Zygotorulaspora mrakii]|uniref:5'-deoxynucleotidase n=1 Tax=Zygotorulaspora mrakii TaxID=42260 RepID=A0A7H9AXL1_ZYGMR|nr:uncharacterized protein HG535_0B01630 [Zygotorulaspora mrakii]QLG71125.1 hypothetical protein HG535_0B01630 [Zygotorulaspora mrakii]